jgi:small subunit ribosomal protein S6
LADTVYECMFILNPNAYAKSPAGAAGRWWNEQKLAFTINGHRKGVYWITYFRMESTAMAKFNRACQLQDMIVRHLAIRIDPRLVDTLIAIAKGERAQPDIEVNLADDEEVATEVAATDGE